MQAADPAAPSSPLDATDFDAWLAASGTQASPAQNQDHTQPGPHLVHDAIPGTPSWLPDHAVMTSQQASLSTDLLGLFSPDDTLNSSNNAINGTPGSSHGPSPVTRRPPTPAPRGAPDADSRRSSRTRANFSPAAIKILKDWFMAHEAHPFAKNDDLEMLESATSLKKKQILMWLANMRRRHISAPNSGMSTPVSENGGGLEAVMGGSGASAVGSRHMPARRATPTPWEGMHPLERWRNSPPEHEAANATAIAQAVCTSDAYLGTDGDLDEAGYTRMRRNRSNRGSSSVSSLETSGSSRGSSSDAYSADSRDSLRLRDRLRNPGARRRRMTNKRRGRGRQPGATGSTLTTTTLGAPQHIYQCTFCPETYKTKYDWQRHEKSMHLSLDQWVCSPMGPTSPIADAEDNQQVSCVYCGVVNPDEQHLLQHNHLMCVDKDIRERTFYRKDHLHQHLRLVHKAQFLPTMESWKVTTERLVSRCGFCDETMDTWTARLNHIAAHFKARTTMASWKGNWGFEPAVLEMLENAMPPYLIHYERNTPLPLNVALMDTPDPGIDLSLTNSYETIKSELRHYVEGNAPYETIGMRGKFYSDDFLQYESCCIIFGSEVTVSEQRGIVSGSNISNLGTTQAKSWLRDLLLLSHPDITQQARLQPLNWVSKARLSHLRIHGKKSIFEECHVEALLRHYVASRTANDGAGLQPTDDELRQHAINIIESIEATSARPAERFADFIKTLIKTSATWLGPFRERCLLDPPSELSLPAVTTQDSISTLPNAKHPFMLSQFAQGTCSSMGRLDYEAHSFVEGDSTQSRMGAVRPMTQPPMPLSAGTAMGRVGTPSMKSGQAPGPSSYYILGAIESPFQDRDQTFKQGTGAAEVTGGQQSPPSRWSQGQHLPILNDGQAQLPISSFTPEGIVDPAALHFPGPKDDMDILYGAEGNLDQDTGLQFDWLSSGLDTNVSATPPIINDSTTGVVTDSTTTTAPGNPTVSLGAVVGSSDDLLPLSGMQGGFQIPIGWQELGFRHLTKELYRFVAMCMSPNNPNRHVPTDEELQYQARWVDYDDDDPWNQTPADNPEWLTEFKKLVGIPCDP